MIIALNVSDLTKPHVLNLGWTCTVCAMEIYDTSNWTAFS